MTIGERIGLKTYETRALALGFSAFPGRVCPRIRGSCCRAIAGAIYALCCERYARRPCPPEIQESSTP